MGKLIVISSPSGTGKNSIIRRLVEIFPNSTRFVTTTTRDPRPGEEPGKDYFFVTQEQFDRMLREDKFIEYNKYAGEWYGSEKEKLGLVLQKYDLVFLALDVNGKQSLETLNIPHVSIFLIPESVEALEQRIEARGGVTKQELKKRMETAKEEMKAADKYDVQVVNPEGKMELAVQKIISFLQDQT